MSLLMDMSLRDFNDLLASKAAAPGGGSTAALAGVLGSALTMMVVNLSLGKKSYEALDDNIKQKIVSDHALIKVLNAKLAELVDEDTKAFTLFMKAMQLPKDTEQEKLIRTEQMQKASLYALEVPLRVADICLQILKHQKDIALYGNINAVSDIGVGAELASGGIKGAALNVQINLPSIEDEATKSDAIHKIDRITREGELLHSDIIAIVKRRIPRY